MSGEQVGELYAVLGIEDLSEKHLELAEQNMRRAAGRMDRIDDPRLGVDTSHGDTDLDRMERHLRDFSNEDYTVTPDVDVSHVDDGRAEGASRLSGMVSDWGTTIVLAAGVIGAAAGSKLAENFMDWAEHDADNDRLAAALGLDAEQSARYGKLAGEIYGQNFGDSLDEVNRSLYLAQSSGLVDMGDSDAEIAAVTERALSLVDVFDQDLPTVLDAASTMVKTGLANDVWEAFDIFASGFQDGTNKADELLASLTEYPAVWQALGIDGQTALGLLSQGLEGGARGADLVADSLKEFAIRGKDGSTATADAYKLLGLDADDMAAKLAAGGDTASGALDTVLDALRKTEDPVKRNAAAVGLFGTQAEDLQGALFNLDPSSAIDGLDDLAGSAERVQETAGDNVAGSLESLQRRTKLAVEGYLGGLYEGYESGGFDGLMEQLGGDVDKLATWWDENGDEITDAFGTWWAEEGMPVMSELAGQAGEIIWDALWAAFEATMERAGEGIGLALDVIWAEAKTTLTTGLSLAEDEVEDMFKAIPNAFIDALNLMIDAWNGLSFSLPEQDLGPLGTIGGQTIDTPDIDHLQHFATGGPVLAPLGSPVLAVVHGGENVQTPAQKHGQDRYIEMLERKVYGTPGGQSGGGNTTNIFTSSPSSYARMAPWIKTG